MRSPSPLPGLIFVVVFALGLALAYRGAETDLAFSAAVAIASFVVAALIANSVKVADQWERVVVLRLGRFRSLAGPGMFFIVPILETTPFRIDVRVIASAFKAEKTLTRDTVPVDVDAVLFWKVCISTYFADASGFASATSLLIGKPDHGMVIAHVSTQRWR